jgi:hypothetical protein
VKQFSVKSFLELRNVKKAKPREFFLKNKVLTFQIIRRFGFSRYIAFDMHLHIHYSRYIVKTMYLEKLKRLVIWNEGSIIALLSIASSLPHPTYLCDLSAILHLAGSFVSVSVYLTCKQLSSCRNIANGV